MPHFGTTSGIHSKVQEAVDTPVQYNRAMRIHQIP